MRDHKLEVRRAILRDMKAAAGIIALVPAESVYPPYVPSKEGETPPYPFYRYGVASSAPFSSSGSNGQTIDVRIHSWARGGDEKAGAMNAAVISLFGGSTDDDIGYELALDSGSIGHVYVGGDQVFQDGAQNDLFHGVVDLRIDIA